MFSSGVHTYKYRIRIMMETGPLIDELPIKSCDFLIATSPDAHFAVEVMWPSNSSRPERTRVWLGGRVVWPEGGLHWIHRSWEKLGKWWEKMGKAGKNWENHQKWSDMMRKSTASLYIAEDMQKMSWLRQVGFVKCYSLRLALLAGKHPLPKG